MKRGQMLRFADVGALDAHMHAKGTPVPAPLESEIQTQVLFLLRKHPRVAAVWRMNVAKGRLQYGDGTASRFMAFGFPGASDLMGVLRRGGRFFGCEVKRPGEHPTDDQQAFLDCVNAAGGLGFVAYSVDDVLRYLPVSA